MSDSLAAVRCVRCGELASDDAAFCFRCGSPLREQAAPVAPSAERPEETERIAAELRSALAPRYELLDMLGAGGMGFVFRAREESLRRLVAVKVLAPSLAEDDVARARFTREARAVAAISHANVIGVYGVGETPALKLPFIVMQYVDGPTLGAWMRTHPRANEATARRIVGEIAGALAAAHSHGVVHRDVKPSNVLIEATTGRAIVLDFGVSALLAPDETTPEAPRMTTTGIVVGTPVYMSPEQAAGDKVQEPSDIYSLGILAYELFASELPFKANSAMGWAAAHMRDTPAPLAARRPEISPEVAQLVDRCLEKAPGARPRAPDIAAGMAPSIESDVQWPPPGLGALLGRGQLLGKVAIVMGIAAATVALCLTVQPALARPDSQWWTRYAEGRDVSGSALGVVNETNTATSSATVWLWRIAIVGGMSTLLVGTIGFLIISARAAVRAANGRRLGWRWSTLVDVLADPDGRNGLLLVGGRELAAVDRARRQDALGARRQEVAWRVAAGASATLVLSAWAFVAILGPAPLDGSGPLMGWTQFLMIVAPAIVGIAVAGLATAKEIDALAPLPARRLHAPTAPAVAGAGLPDDVASWYASVARADDTEQKRAEADHSSASTMFAARVGGSVVGAALVGGAIAVGLVVAANLVAAWNLERLGPETAHLASTMRRLRETDPLGGARRAWVRYLPTDSALSSAQARRQIERLGGRPAAADTLPEYSTPPARLLGGGGATGGTRPAVADAIKAAVNGLSADSMATFAAAAAHPRTSTVRRLSVEGTDLFTASLDRPLADYRLAADVPEPPYPRLLAGAQANALGAVVAMTRRDYGEAERRLGENAALAERFLEVPRRFAGTFGAGLLQELALLPLAEVEDLRGDPRAGVELRGAADVVRDLLLDQAWTSRLIGLAAAPDDMKAYTAAIRDPHLPAGLRAEGFEGALLGFCLNPREVVRGPQVSRQDALRAAADSIPDLKAGPALAALVLRGWRNDRAPSPGGKPLGSVLTRIAFCTNIGRR